MNLEGYLILNFKSYERLTRGNKRTSVLLRTCPYFGNEFFFQDALIHASLGVQFDAHS